jgi:hypothetical protein
VNGSRPGKMSLFQYTYNHFPFTRAAEGVCVENPLVSILDSFSMFLTDEILDFIVQQSN